MTSDPVSAVPPITKIKIAILGGGPGGISAAFWLTATPELRAKYDVAVYTPGWRLGGKCATGRNMSIGARIEEHGLHILMGCYTNAFRTIRSCFEEWKPRPGGPFQTWSQAFTPQRQITLQERVSGETSADWTSWNFVLPRLPGEPGDPDAAGAAVSAPRASMAPITGLETLVAALASWLADHLQNSIPPEVLVAIDYQATLRRFRTMVLQEDRDRDTVDDVHQSLEHIATRIRVNIAMTPLTSAVSRPHSNASEPPRTLCPLACTLILADLGLSVAIGWLRDVFLQGDRGIDKLNARDFRQWLKSCGATEAALASAPIRALYDLTFAFRDGDSSSIDKGSIAAGVTLRFMLEATLGYRDAPLWKTNAGTADTVFTPLYQVLRARGVSINFFQRVTGIAPTADSSKIGAVTLDQQANLIAGNYEPFVTVGDLDCWPNQPRWNQLENGAALCAQGVNFESPADKTVAKTWQLTLGHDFDIVVLAVPPDVTRTIAPQLAHQCARWQAMLDNSASVATGAFQLWLTPDLEHLGWTLGPTVLTAYAEPFDSWADLSHLLAREAWTGPNAPRALEYFCGCRTTQLGSAPNASHDAQAWLQKSISTLWPATASKGAPIHKELLVSAYYRVNLYGSDRYVQTLAGSVGYRISPATPVFGNMYLAGDWTLTRLSGGCFESAIESGMLAAAAISGGR